MQNKKISIPQWIYLQYLETIKEVKFTNREIDIVACILSGKASKVIASLLSIAPKTVEAHTRNIMLKLECNSREGIIEFIEKSGKLSLIQKYYLNLLIHQAFEEGLQKIALIPAQVTPQCYLAYWPEREPQDFLISHLKHHLHIAGIKVFWEIRKNSETPFHVSKHAPLSKAQHLIYAGSKETLSQFQARQEEELLKFDSLQGPPIFLLLTEKKASVDFPCISWNDHETYYSFFLALLDALCPHVDKESVFSDFYHHSQMIGSELKPLPTLPKTEPPEIKKNHSLPSSKKKYIFWGIGICIFLYFLVEFSFKERRVIQDSEEKASIRSDLLIPSQSTLLKRSKILSQIEKKFHEESETHSLSLMPLKGPRQTSLGQAEEKTLGGPGVQTVALVGIGGAGKTTIAHQYARAQKAPVVWTINAETNDSLMNSFKNLAYRLAQTKDQKNELNFIEKIQNPEEKEKQLLFFVKKCLKEKPSWLLIYDNVETFSDIKNYFPHDSGVWGNGRVLVTTQDSNIKNTGCIPAENVIQIEELDESQALKLFARILSDTHTEKLKGVEKEKMLAFLKNLPYFPLDISIAASYIKTNTITYEEYLNRIRQPSKEFENIQQALLKERGNYTKTRYGIITLSLQNLINYKPEFKELLFFIFLLDSQKIPKELLEAYQGKLLTEKFIYNLGKRSLITREFSPTAQTSLPTFSLHRSTQAIGFAFLLNLLTPEEKKKFTERAIAATKAFYESCLQKERCKDIIPLIPHLESLMRNLKELKITPRLEEKYGKDLLLMTGYAHYYCSLNLMLAKKYLSQAVKISHNENLPLPKLAQLFQDLGSICVIIGHLEEALEYCQKSITLFEKLPSSEISIAENLLTIGRSYCKQNNFEKSDKYFKDALIKISKTNLKNKKEIESEIYDQLASLYSKTYITGRKASEGERYALKSIRILNGTEKNEKLPLVNKENSCSLAKHLWRLGQVYNKLRKYKEAHQVIEEAQKTLTSQTCSEDVLLKARISLSRGELLLRKGYLKGVETKLTDAITTFENLVGESAGLIAKALRAETRIRLGKLDAAYQDCLSIFNLRNRMHDNFSDLMYLTCFYHAAIIKFKQQEFEPSTTYFSDFFKHAQEFCKSFLESTVYKDLEAKGTFNPISYDPSNAKKNIKDYLKRSTAIFSAIYGKSHEFVQGYVLKN